MHTNKLINETSPYLLQHAHNPVDWYPWSEEALQRAKEEDKPILVSIGYSACHWCHVMERESFEDESVAELMNKHFINIKVDREERPDLDHIYMDAIQAMTSGGGWPLNAFLTPEGKPFYGGTYFPPVAAHNRPSWKEILTGVEKAYREKKNDINSQAENLVEHLVSSNSFGIEKKIEKEQEVLFKQENCDLIALNILKQSDTEWGGFGQAPKFPQTFSIQYLLRHYHFTKDEKSLVQGLLSLDKMISGGIYDQLGGGFARYSTDKKWLAPHFEKMLYDNALLIGVISEAYQLTKKENYAEVIKKSMAFIEREMLNEEGGFYSALDADSEGVEGKYYTWSKHEVDELLGNDAELYCEFYNITAKGNWEHTNILWVQKNMEEFAANKNISLIELKNKIDECNEILMIQREKRIHPQLDDKILLGWNAIMNIACCKAYAALGENSFKQMAIRNMEFLEVKMKISEIGWNHTYKNQQSKIPAFLDDYAYLIQAYIHLQEITGNQEYLNKAHCLTEFVIDKFSEEKTGYFFYTNLHQKDVILRKKEVYDGATPSGNSIMALSLLYLSIVFEKEDWNNRSSRIVESLGSTIINYPGSFGVWASVLQLFVVGINEIAILGDDAFENLPYLLNEYIPNKVIQTSQHDQPLFPLLKNKYKPGGSNFFLCKNYECSEPVFSLNEFFAKL